MSLTVTVRYANRGRVVRLHMWHLALAGLLVLGVSVSGWLRPASTPPSDYQSSMNIAKRQLQEVDALRASTQAEVRHLAARVGQLQAQTYRLEALGQRLAEQQALESEFDFQTPPAIGGPSFDDTAEYRDHDLVMLLEQMDQLSSQLNDRGQQLEIIEALLLNKDVVDTSYVSGRPIGKGWLSSYYGKRPDPFSGRPSMHKGIDFAGKEGAAVVATGAGVVVWSGRRFGYGNLIEIDHGGGYKTRYGHNKALLVKEGDVVSKGQTVALMGSTGRSTGPHVHYEVLKNNKQINPIKYVYRSGR